MARSESNEFPVAFSSTRTAAASANEINEMIRTIHNTVIKTIPLLQDGRRRFILSIHQRNCEHVSREVNSHRYRIVFHDFSKPIVPTARDTIEITEARH